MKAILLAGLSARNICCCHGWEASCSDSFTLFPLLEKILGLYPLVFLWGALGLSWNSFRELSLCKYENNKRKTKIAESGYKYNNRSSPKMGVLPNKHKETRKQKKTE
jgi:hypothetical protein